jgi:predicted AAA+ superfamily ATPase
MLRDIVLVQKRELEQRLSERYVQRDVAIPEPLGDMILVVLGPRRAGKSFFAMQHVRSLGGFGYVNFDDERLAGLDDADALLAAVDSVYDSPRHLLLDEIQNLPQWELVVNRMQRQGYRLTLTGSNAHLLSAELATHLTGRHIPVVLFPFSFPEYLAVRERELTQAEKAEAFRSFLEEGGYPEPLIKGLSRREYLSTLVRSTLYKDVVVRRRIRSPQGLDDLSAYLMANVGQRHSLTALASLLGGRSVHTVRQYLGHLEEAFLFHSLRRFSFKVREQVRTPQKTYCIDNGLVTASAFRFSAGLGSLMENAVATTLRRQELQGHHRVFYWQGAAQEEVDFVIQRGRKVTALIQVCADLSSPRVRSRETRALVKAGAALECKNLLLLNDTEDSRVDVSWYGSTGHIRILPVWKWMCQGGSMTD